MQHALLFMDLDRFSFVNDTCGHATGDLVLQLLAKLLQGLLRDSDVLARLGGDELGVLLTACPLPRALAIAEEIRRAVPDFRFPYGGRSIELSVSIGLVPIDHDSSSMTELMIAAEHACSMAKEHGRNRVQLYRESDAVMARRQGEMRWVARLNEALELHHFRLFSQPIVPLQGGAGGHEEVLMWPSSSRTRPRCRSCARSGSTSPRAMRWASCGPCCRPDLRKTYGHQTSVVIRATAVVTY